jgi:transposase
LKGRAIIQVNWVLSAYSELNDGYFAVTLRMQKRFIALTEAERMTLECGRHHHAQHQFRARCQALLWSAAGQPVAQLAALSDVNEGTIYSWFNRWERDGLAGLANAKGQGRHAILQAPDRAQVAAAVRANRQQLKDVTAKLNQELARSFSPLTLKRFLKSVGPNGGASAIV